LRFLFFKIGIKKSLKSTINRKELIITSVFIST
jgi:hypothetical protein